MQALVITEVMGFLIPAHEHGTVSRANLVPEAFDLLRVVGIDEAAVDRPNHGLAHLFETASGVSEHALASYTLISNAQSPKNTCAVAFVFGRSLAVLRFESHDRDLLPFGDGEIDRDGRYLPLFGQIAELGLDFRFGFDPRFEIGRKLVLIKESFFGLVESLTNTGGCLLLRHFRLRRFWSVARPCVSTGRCRRTGRR